MLQITNRLIVTVALYASMVVAVWAAAPGTLDPTFNGTGMVTAGIGSRSDAAYAIVQQADGKLVLAGESDGTGNDVDLAIMRFNSDGTLDNTFGSSGKAHEDINSQPIGGRAVIQLSGSGKLLVAGVASNGTNNDFALMLFDTDGTRTTSFGPVSGGGVLTAVGASDDGANAVVQRSDGKLVAAGYSNSSGTNGYDFALVRYSVNGVVDTTFGTNGNGIVTTDIAGGSDDAYAMIQQSDGKLILAGYAVASGASSADFAVARYNGTTGALDTSFSSDGKVTTSFGGGDDIAYAALLQTDGKIVVVGSSVQGTDTDIAVARYTSSGVLDKSFSGDGKILTNVAGHDDAAYGVVQQSDGKLLVSGASNQGGSNDDMVLVRYNTDGTLDTTFNGTGILLTSFGSGSDVALGMVQQADGQVVTAGFANNGGYDFAAARYLFNDDDGDGILDTNDNCQYVSNADQLNTDGDSQGDACDTDDDNDGVLDTADAFPTNDAASVDTDGDGMPDDWNSTCNLACQTGSGLTLDDDDDNDGILDVDDPFPLNPFLFDRIDGDAKGDDQGLSVANIGDVNSDGYDDFIIGAPKNDVLLPGLTSAAKDVGSAYVYSGKTRLLLHTFDGAAKGDEFGNVVAGVGDVNHDSIPDFAIAAHKTDAIDPITLKVVKKDRGTVTVYSGADFSEIFHIDGEAAGDALGDAIAGAGDVDSDGYADVLVGAAKADVVDPITLKSLSDAGAVYLYSGQTHLVLNKFEGKAKKDYFGFSIAAGSDLDHDANAELVIGAYAHDPIDPITLKALTDAGSVYVYSSTTPYNLVTELDGTAKGDNFGFSLSVIDTGADSFKDLLVASPKADIVNGTTLKLMKDAGKVQVFSDASGVALYSVNGTQAGALFGNSVSNAANVNNIGSDDFVVGSPKMDVTVAGVVLKDAGQVSVHSASDGTQFFVMEGDNKNCLYGNVVAGGGDYNNDGFADFIIGSPYYDVSTAVATKTTVLKDSGRVEIISGASTD